MLRPYFGRRRYERQYAGGLRIGPKPLRVPVPEVAEDVADLAPVWALVRGRHATLAEVRASWSLSDLAQWQDYAAWAGDVDELYTVALRKRRSGK